MNAGQRVLAIVVTLLVLSGILFARDKKLGLGVIVGEPTGVSLKLWKSATTAWDAGAAWSFENSGHLHFHADYLWHNSDWLREQRLTVYYGPGARLKLAANSHLGLRAVAGVSYWLTNFPIETFVEVVPIFDLFPATEINFNFGFGVRFYFCSPK